jgi:hypothetical protein
LKKQYFHTYQDKNTISLSVSAIGSTVAIVCDPPIVEPRHMAEHIIWRDEFVIPDLMDNLEPNQIAALMTYVMGMIGGDKEAS